MIARLSWCREEDRDGGVYAVLYAILLLVFIGMTAMVVDIAALRQDRRTDRMLTDNAAIAGANALGNEPPDANAACRSAWLAIRTNLGVPKTAGTDNCSTFPAVTDKAAFVACPSTAKTAVGTISVAGVTYDVGVTWPVPDDSPLMTNPDIRPISSGFTQATVPDDGTACLRIAVTIGHSHNLVFASALGYHNGATTDHSVALNVFEPGGGGTPAPLVILDPHKCGTLTAEGGAGILVGANENSDPKIPGVIAVDSDGSACGGGQSVIDSNSSSSISCTPLTYSIGHCPSAIWAEDTSDNQHAQIHVYALRSGTALPAYQPAQVTCTTSALPSGPTGALCPAPIPEFTRIGRDFFDALYNCTGSSCDPSGPTAGISRFASFVKNNFTMTGKCSTDTYPPTFACLDSTQTCLVGQACAPVSGGDQCKSALPTVYPAENIFVDCPSFNVKSGTVAFPTPAAGGTVVFAGNVSAVGGCLAFNDTGSSCSAPVLSDLPADGPAVYVAGALSTGSGGTFIAPQTFVMVGSCNRDGSTCTKTPANVNMQDNKAGSILWSAPRAPGLDPLNACPTGTSPPPVSCFAKLALWNEFAAVGPTSSQDNVFGQAGLLLRGSFFTPNAQFNVQGGGNADIDNAQFITGSLDVGGGGLLTMIPDSTYTNNVPLLTPILIR